MHINEFLNSEISGKCDLLRRLYQFFDEHSGDRQFCIDGLTLLDLEPYGGTVLYDRQLTPRNTLTFACTGGDDVHFGMLARNGLYGDESPIVMTVPMADDVPENVNFIVGQSLHDFLCMGCAHGYRRLECLAYGWQHELFDLLAGPAEDDPSYSKFRAELALTPWDEVRSRQASLDSQFKPLLEYRR